MERRGSLECEVGKYKIFQRITVGLNREVLAGYELVGPGADSSWKYTLEEAIQKAQELNK